MFESERVRAVLVGEQVLVETGQDVHAGAGSGCRRSIQFAGRDEIARVVERELGDGIACGGHPGPRVGEGELRPPREIADGRGTVAREIAERELAQ